MRFDIETVLTHNGENVSFSGFLPTNYEEIDSARRHPAVILLAGGAYWRKSPREKEPVALKLLAHGISPWILEYSVAPHVFPQALCEVLMAVLWLRTHGEEYHIDTSNISVCGFSAGGHLAASTGCFWNQDFVQERLSNPGWQARPDKLILCYPVISSEQYAHQDSIRCLLGEEGLHDKNLLALVSLEKQVNHDFPPTFLWHTTEDASVPVQNTLLMGSALAEQGIPLELHIYPTGRHGLSTGDFASCGDLVYGQCYPCAEWIDRAVDFIYNVRNDTKGESLHETI